MNHTSFFSIIICLFNSEKFFIRGLDCITKQIFKDYEIILVDDGSSDATSSLCDKASASYPNIKVIHQENQGLGIARNKGIDAAHGKYLCFFDIDDIVDAEWLGNIYSEINEINPDLLIYGYKEYNIRLKSENTFCFERTFWADKDQLKKGFTQILSGVKFNNGFAWNKVYKKEFIDIHSVRFTDNLIQQDEIFNHQVYQYFPKILISDKILYKYFIYEKGNNRNRFIPNRMKIFESVKNSFQEIKNKFAIKDKTLEDYIHLRFLNNILFNRNPQVTFKDRKFFFTSIINNAQVMHSVDYFMKNRLGVKNVHQLVFNIYCYGISKKSSTILLLADYIYYGMYGLYHRLLR